MVQRCQRLGAVREGLGRSFLEFVLLRVWLAAASLCEQKISRPP